MKNLVIANWKMNPSSFEEARQLFSGVKRQATKCSRTTTVVCPTAAHVGALSSLARRGRILKLGAQDVFWEKEGSFTGRMSAQQMKDLGVSYILAGHSERRALGETDEMVAKKVHSILEEGVFAVVCVGERERDKSGAYLRVLEEQLTQSLAGVSRNSVKKLIVAYEPVWAIGKHASDAMNSHELHQMSLYIRKILVERFGKTAATGIPIIYGGSAEPTNAEELLKEGAIAGFLVGHASLVAKDFNEILSIVDRVRQ